MRLAIWGDSLAKYGEGIDPYLCGGSMGAVQVSGLEAQKRVYSHSGADTATLLGSTSEITGLSPAPDAVLVQAGTNDVIAATSLSTTLANLATIYARFEAVGTRVIMSTIPPLGGPFQYNGKQAAARTLNQALRLLAASSGRLIVDPASVLVDASTQRYQSAYDSGDNVHPTSAGLSVWAAKVLTDLGPILGPAPMMVELSDGSSAINQFAKAAFLTGGGNLAGSPSTNLAESLGVTSLASGVTVARTASSGSSGFNWQTFTTSSASGATTFYQQSTYSLTVGRKMLVAVRYRRTSGSSGAFQITYSCYHGSNVVDLNVPLLGDNGISQAVTDSLHLAYFTVPSGATTGQLQMTVPANDGVFGFACPTVMDLTAMGLA